MRTISCNGLASIVSNFICVSFSDFVACRIYSIPSAAECDLTGRLAAQVTRRRVSGISTKLAVMPSTSNWQVPSSIFEEKSDTPPSPANPFINSVNSIVTCFCFVLGDNHPLNLSILSFFVWYGKGKEADSLLHFVSSFPFVTLIAGQITSRKSTSLRSFSISCAGRNSFISRR